jgi:hypothetical protein
MGHLIKWTDFPFFTTEMRQASRDFQILRVSLPAPALPDFRSICQLIPGPNTDELIVRAPPC